jgi:hypothetical protein
MEKIAEQPSDQGHVKFNLRLHAPFDANGTERWIPNSDASWRVMRAV